VLARVGEQTPEVVDLPMFQLGGTVLRRATYDLEAELAAAEEAQREAKRQAREELMPARMDQQNTPRSRSSRPRSAAAAGFQAQAPEGRRGEPAHVQQQRHDRRRRRRAWLRARRIRGGTCGRVADVLS
jgi:hypothetical protein